MSPAVRTAAARRDAAQAPAAAAPVLGIVQMANRPLTWLGNLGNPHSFAYPVRYATARNAYTERILRGDPEVGREYLRQARALQRQGVSAVLATCGFAVLYQPLLAAGLRVPVASSSLLALPLALRSAPQGGEVGVITYDSECLTRRFLLAGGASRAELGRLRVAGLEGTETWRQLALPEPEVPLQVLESDVRATLGRFLRRHRRVRSVLFECSALCPFTPRLRAETELPIFDFLSVADALMASVGVAPFADPARIVDAEADDE